MTVTPDLHRIPAGRLAILQDWLTDYGSQWLVSVVGRRRVGDEFVQRQAHLISLRTRPKKHNLTLLPIEPVLQLVSK